MTRFLLVALPLLLLLMALFGLALEVTGLEPDASALMRSGVGRAAPPPTARLVGDWLVQALALTALFLLVQGRSGAWWLDGLVTGWIAWVFRGPVLVFTVTAWTRLPRDPWWQLSLRWLALYTLCGLLLAIAARRLRLER